MTAPWKQRLVPVREVLNRIRPGMTIFLGTGAAEPSTLLRHLMTSDMYNARDLELIQICSFGDTLSLEELQSSDYRLKTFFSGWVSKETIASGRVDLVAGRFSQIPRMFASGRILADAAFLQISPPDRSGFCSLGISMDVAREVMEHAALVVGEVNPDIPFTFGDTIVMPSDFDLLVEAEDEPIYFERPMVDETMQRVAANVATVIRDGDCLNYSTWPLFEALSPLLVHKRHLGVHSPYITDALMDLLRSGAVTNTRKDIFRGKSVVSYAQGTPSLMSWLDRNPLVEFQRIDRICDPVSTKRNPRFTALFQARKVDLMGGICFPIRPALIESGPPEALDLIAAAEHSPGGRSIFALPSRSPAGASNVILSLDQARNQLRLRDAVNLIVTEYGIANIRYRTLRERAQALIDIAHPDDREALVAQAKKVGLIYPDQIFVTASARLYPYGIAAKHTFKGGVAVRFRAIRPSDEEPMRRLFYRFSERRVIDRFLSPVKTMPHRRIQEHVNVDYRKVMSVVGIVGDMDDEKIIAEARFVREEPDSEFAELGFLVDEHYQGLGIGSYLCEMLVRLARERGLRGFTAEVLRSNGPMLKVFEKQNLYATAQQYGQFYHYTLYFEETPSGSDAGARPSAG